MRGRQGQIAILFLVIAAVTVVLALFLINLGQVGVTKTATAVAADTAALSVGSSVGSVARQLALGLGDGKKYKDKKCKLNILAIILFVIIIIVIIIVTILCWGSCTAAVTTGFTLLLSGMVTPFFAIAIPLVLMAVGAALSLGIREGILAPREARAFNQQFASFSNMKDPIRESAILVAMLRVVDNPTRVPDTTDIDGDGNVAEETSHFARWYDDRLEKLVLESVNQKNQALPEMAALRAKLAALKPELQALSDDLDNKIIPIFTWVESIPKPISFWMPGDQANLGADPDESSVPCEWDNNLDCGPGAAGVSDKVDWMTVQLDTFLPFIDMIVAMPDDVLLAASFQIQEIMQEYWLGELKEWRKEMQKWVTELTPLRNQIPWPPVFTLSGASCGTCSVAWPPSPLGSPPTMTCTDPLAVCSFTSNPPALPPASLYLAAPEILPPTNTHPLTVVINRLNAAIAAINSFNPSFSKFTPKPVSIDNPVYSWEDNRGWHHVQVEVGGFEIPKMKVKRSLFRPCVLVKHAKQQIKVAVTRYDQDNVVASGSYTMRYRQNASGAVGFDPEGDNNHDPLKAGYNPAKYLAQGLRSESEVAHGYKPNSVGIVKTK